MTDALIDATNALCFLHDPETVFEICAFDPKNPTSPLWTGRANGLVVGWYDNPEMAAKTAFQMCKESKPAAIYTTLNPCKAAIHARAENRLKAQKIKRTSDKDITKLVNLLIDVDADPGGVAGVSSTEEEHQDALLMAKRIRIELSLEGWPEPMQGDSGNGAHLTYPLDLPNTPENVALLKNVLAALALRYKDTLTRLNLGIDQAVYNPSRLTKLYGTWVRKGDSTKTRPHRLAKIISLPEKRLPVSQELLQKLADTLPSEDPKTSKAKESSADTRVDVRAYLTHYGKEVIREKPWQGATLFCLAHCIFDENHRDNEAAIGQWADGALFYQCFHSTCQGRTWKEAREKISGADNLRQFTVGGGAKTPSKGRVHEHTKTPYRGSDISKVEQALITAQIDLETITYITKILEQKEQDRSLSQRVIDWALLTEGDFILTDCYAGVGVLTSTDKNAVQQALIRAAKDPRIPIYKCGTRRGCYRTVDHECQAIDFKNIEKVSPLPIKWPLSLETLVEIYPKNIAIVAGSKDAGKTAFMLNLIRLNQDNFSIHYFCSEIAVEEFRKRLDLFGHDIESWKFEFKERAADFEDAIVPDAFNIIDFLEIHSEFYNIGELIKRIRDRLTTGFAAIALQKDPNKKLGRGDTFSLEKARLYLTLDNRGTHNELTIISGKNWASERNPRDIQYKFKLVQGAKILNDGEVKK